MPAFGFGTPFAEQLDFFRSKLNLPTEAWDDITRSAHDRAFIVAGAAKADVLQGLRDAVGASMAGGEGLSSFRQRFKAVVARTGWSGWTGEGSPAGEAWRTRVIYQTNMATSYAAGRYRQLTEPEFAAVRPFWKYVHSEGQLHPRPQHLAWNGLTLPIGHPFWKTHFAPNGWGCRCEIHAVKKPGAYSEPPADWDAIDPETGAPVGIDKGFDYAPGANAATPLQALIDQKLIKLDAPIGAAMAQALQPALALERQQQWWQTLDEWTADPKPRGRSAVLGALKPEVLRWLDREGYALPASAAVSVDDGLWNGAKQRRHMADQDGLSPEDWRALTALLEKPSGVYRDVSTGKLIFVADGIGPTKAAVEFEPGSTAGNANKLVSAFRTSATDIAGMVKGGLWEVVP